MTIERIFTPGLAQVGYLVADDEAHEVAVIDPRRDIHAYVAWAEERGDRIVAILETHIHADFVSGARELATATGAPIYASAYGEQAIVDRMLRDGDEVRVGRLALRALWTPGHTPEHLSYLLIDPDRGSDPVALFSGDVLFAGEVGRPDLLGHEETERLAGALYHTVVDRLSRLNGDVIVYPGHTAGSACGKKIGDAPTTTIGREVSTSYAFQARSEDQFVAMVLKDMPKPPAYYPVLKRINKFGPALLANLLEAGPLSPAEVARAQESGALVIDARTPEAFGKGHVPEAVSAGLGPNFAAWLGWIAPYDRDLVLVVEDEAGFAEAATELHRIGLDRIAGYLEGGVPAWRASGRDVETLSQISVQELARRLDKTGDRLQVLDVRGDDEWGMGHIDRAFHRFGGEIAQGADAPIPIDMPVAVICATGYRSTVAASLLRARGYDNLMSVEGGMEAWAEAQLPLSRVAA
jgi:hydroxyacylglutathione hydrolase